MKEEIIHRPSEALVHHPSETMSQQLTKAYLKDEGKDIGDFTNTELGQMFYVDRTTISEGLR